MSIAADYIRHKAMRSIIERETAAALSEAKVVIPYPFPGKVRATGDGRFIAVGSDANVWESMDGIAWKLSKEKP